jgi:hypothetical protein
MADQTRVVRVKSLQLSVQNTIERKPPKSPIGNLKITGKATSAKVSWVAWWSLLARLARSI